MAAWLHCVVVVFLLASTNAVNKIVFKVTGDVDYVGVDHQKVEVIIASNSDDDSIKDAIAAATGLIPDSFGLTTASGASVAISADSLEHNAVYEVVPLRKLEIEVDEEVKRIDDEQRRRLPKGVRDARLPRVMMACIATGRYRSMGMDALYTARRRFGHDAIPSFFLLTDDITGVDPHINPKVIPYRGWPESGLQKYEDLLRTLGAIMDTFDYFYFMDADIKFEEDVLLADVSGDLVGVEHPMYPRYAFAFCEPQGKGLCRYPYDRNPESHAYIPWEFDKKAPDYTWANTWYIQSAFWGGKTKIIKPLLRELAENVAVDYHAGRRAMAVQDERYLNWLFWAHRNDPNINIRVLGHSYLFPGVIGQKGFGPWLHNTSRPIIRHIDKGADHLPIDEMEIESLEHPWKCIDAYNERDGKIGMYGCHHKANSAQAWRYSDAKPKLVSQTKKTCLDAAGVEDGGHPLLRPCVEGSRSQAWKYNKDTGQFVNELTGLCLKAKMDDVHPRKSFIPAVKCSQDPEQKWRLKPQKSN